MKFRNVVKYGFNEMLSLKETYIIGKQGEPNPYVMLTYFLMISRVFLWNSGYSSPTKTAQFSIAFSGASFFPFFFPLPPCFALSRASLMMCFASCRYSN